MDGIEEGTRAPKAELLGYMARARDARAAWVAGLSVEAKEAAPSASRWGAKATLAHMAHWNLVLLQALELRASGERVPYLWASTDADNARLVSESGSRTWSDVAGEAERAYADLFGWVERLSDEQLADPDDFAWQEGWPLWHTFLGNTYFHYLDHLAAFCLEADRPEQIAALRAEMEQVDASLDLHWD